DSNDVREMELSYNFEIVGVIIDYVSLLFIIEVGPRDKLIETTSFMAAAERILNCPCPILIQPNDCDLGRNIETPRTGIENSRKEVHFQVFGTVFLHQQQLPGTCDQKFRN
ncbi:hypothetical protein PMAYCL1PPCAC_20049, partial [Pristionchus mayeri]